MVWEETGSAKSRKVEETNFEWSTWVTFLDTSHMTQNVSICEKKIFDKKD
jgi:hypothetical protein